MTNALATMERMSGAVYFSNSTDGVTEEETPTGSLIVRGLRVFKAGTFRDSRGDQRTWERLHLDQMVGHFTYLKDAGIFVDVPWRKDHWTGVESMAGYIVDLSVVTLDGTDFLAADVEFTDPGAIASYKNKTFRARSAEVGIYETNDEAFYWPCLLGVAWVDIGAVEGLYSKSTTTTHSLNGEKPFIHLDEEPAMPEKTPAEIAAETAAAEQAAAVKAAADAEAAALVAATAEKAAADKAATDAALAAVNLLSDEARAALDEQLVTSTNAKAPVAFQIGGREVTDPKLVQEYIASIEGVNDKSRSDARAAFVKGLADADKILKTQVDETVKYVNSLSDEQYAAFEKIQAGVPGNPLFAKHGTPGGGAPEAAEELATEIATLEAIQLNHTRSGRFTPAQLQETDSFKRLTALKATK